MAAKNRAALLSSITLLVLLLSLTVPVTAFADEGTPTPEETTENPPSDPTDEPAAPPAEEPGPSEEPLTVPQVLDQLPEDTDLVILDENGEALPLATEAAAQVLAVPDPYFYVGGVIYSFTSADCDPGAPVTPCSSPIQAALDYLDGTSGISAWPGVGASPDPGSYFYVEAGNYTENLTIGGGTRWNSGASAPSSMYVWGSGGQVVLDGTITITGMQGLGIVNFTLEDTDISGNATNITASGNGGALYLASTNVTSSVGNGITVTDHTGDIFFNVVNSSNNALHGASLDNTAGSGFVYIGGSQLDDNGGNGLDLQTDGAVTIVTSSASNNDGHGVNLTNTSVGSAIGIYTSTFEGNGQDGLNATGGGNITLASISASLNLGIGALLDNSGSSGYSIAVGQSTFDYNDVGGLHILSGGEVDLTNLQANFNELDGLYVAADGGIALMNVRANENDGIGAFLDNSCDCTAEGISIDGASEFSNNDGEGLVALSSGNITLNNVTANYNYYNGAWLDNTYGSGNVGIYNSFFDGNVADDDYAGLNVDSNGFVTLSGISASNNGGDGADVGYQAGDGGYGNWSGVLVEDSVFNNNAGTDQNWGWGLYLDYGLGDVSIDDLTALNNLYEGLFVNTTGNVLITNAEVSNTVDDEGADFDVDGNVTICSSTFSNNSSYGVDGSDISGVLTLSDVSFSGNNGGGPQFAAVTVVVTSGACGDGGQPGEGKAPVDGSLPINLVPVTGGAAGLDCSVFTGTILMLTNGDSLTFLCPTQGDASAQTLGGDGLPGDLPEGFTFASSLSGAVTGGDSEPLPGQVIISFVIPDDLADSDLAILFWDGSAWVDLQGASFDDGRMVFDGGHHTGDGHFESSTNFIGTFVLVTK